MNNKQQIFNSIKQNNLRQVTLLIQAGCDVNIINSSGQTPLIASLISIHDVSARCRLVTQLIKAGADVNKADRKRRFPLTYACALNQTDTLRLLLRQSDITTNVGDYDGVTPLMLAASLGNVDAVRVMMEANLEGSVSIDLGARDNNGWTAADHARHRSDSVSSTTSHDNQVNNSLEIQRLLAACGGIGELTIDDAGMKEEGGNSAALRSRPLTPTEQDVAKGDIELVDMRGSSPRRTAPKGQIGEKQPSTFTNTTATVSQTVSSSNERKDSIGEAEDKILNAGPEESETDTARLWAENLKQEHEAARRLSALVSPAPSSRPGSRQASGPSIALNEKLSTGQSGRRSQGGSAGLGVAQHPNRRPGSRLRVPGSGRASRNGAYDDEEEDISLESLTELLGTVRQYAREIHEIYAPMQREEEERNQKMKKRLARKKSKELEKNFLAAAAPLAPPPTHPAASSQKHEVRVEIHAIEDHQQKQLKQWSGHAGKKPQGPAHSHSHDPAGAQAPVAHLTVEDEQLLSKTWPRGGRFRGKSRERFWADRPPQEQSGTSSAFPSSSTDHQHGRGFGPPSGGSSVSYPCSPTASFTASDRLGGRTQAGPRGGVVDIGNIQHERDILNKAFMKMQSKSGPIQRPPPTKTKTTAGPGQGMPTPEQKRVQEQVMNSRQSVIQVARQHQQNRQQQQQQQQPLPSISIIGPMDQKHQNESFTGSDTQRSRGRQRTEEAGPREIGGALPSGSSHDMDLGMYGPPSPGIHPPSMNYGSEVYIGGDSGTPQTTWRQSKDGGNGVKSSNKRAGLRHRKSVDKGLGNGVVLEKY